MTYKTERLKKDMKSFEWFRVDDMFFFKIDNICVTVPRLTWSMWSMPGKSGAEARSSAMMQPTDHTSTV